MLHYLLLKIILFELTFISLVFNLSSCTVFCDFYFILFELVYIILHLQKSCTYIILNKAKLIFMGRKPPVRHKGEGIHLGFAAKELEQTQYGVSVVKGGATSDVRGSEI